MLYVIYLRELSSSQKSIFPFVPIVFSVSNIMVTAVNSYYRSPELKILYKKCSLFSSYSIKEHYSIVAVCPFSTEEV